MKKDFYLETLELMIEDYMDENPDVTWEQAHKMLATKIYDVAIVRMNEMVDYCRVVMEDC